MALPRFDGGNVSTSMDCSQGARPPPPIALRHARNDQPCHRRRHRAGQRTQRKERDRDHVITLASQPIGEPGAHWNDYGVGHQIAGQRPGRFVVGGREVSTDMPQRDVRDRSIEYLHERGQRQNDRDQPRAVHARRGIRWCPALIAGLSEHGSSPAPTAPEAAAGP